MKPTRRAMRRIALGFISALCLIAISLACILMLPTHWPATASVADPNPHVKHYYLSLGDSLSFGFQPNFNWDQGFAMIWWTELQKHGSRQFVDYGCSGETTGEFIHGGCPFSLFRHDYYSGPQLAAAVNFIKEHKGQVSPVTLVLGADDLHPDIKPDKCEVDEAKWNKDLARMDRNLKEVILPRLLQALKDKSGHLTGQLIMLNYYDPYANECPRLHNYLTQLNKHIEDAASQYNVPVVDVAAAYGDKAPNPNICKYTWYCTFLRSVHPNTTGYGVIVHALERTTGY